MRVEVSRHPQSMISGESRIYFGNGLWKNILSEATELRYHLPSGHGRVFITKLPFRN